MELLMQFFPASHHFIHLVRIFSYAPCSETTLNNLILIMEEKMYVKNRLTEVNTAVTYGRNLAGKD
jgi:hypothetical protein